MSREVELFALDVVFVDGCRDKHVDKTSFEVAHGSLQRKERSCSGLLAGVAQFYLDFLVDAFH